jgi:hypothetical protein
MTNKSIRDYINLIEAAQSEVVTNSPLVRHIEKELTAIGYKKGTPEFDAYFKDAMAYYRQHGNFGNADTQGLGEEIEEGWTKLPSGDYQNSHTGVRSSKPPVKKKRGEKTGAEWDAIEKAKKDKEQGVAEGLPQTLRKVVPGYAKREIDKKMDAGKFGKTDADKDANFQRYKKIQDKLKEQGVTEEQIDETSPEAIAKISQITRR